MRTATRAQPTARSGMGSMSQTLSSKITPIKLQSSAVFEFSFSEGRVVFYLSCCLYTKRIVCFHMTLWSERKMSNVTKHKLLKLEDQNKFLTYSTQLL